MKYDVLSGLSLMLSLMLFVLALLVSTAGYSRSHYFGVSLLFAYFLIGLSFGASMQNKAIDDSTGRAQKIYCARIVAEPVVGDRWTKCKLKLSGSKKRLQGEWKHENIKILVWLSSESAIPEAGDLFFFRAEIDFPSENPIPGQFDYGSYLKRQGLAGQVWLRSAKYMSISAPGDMLLRKAAVRLKGIILCQWEEKGMGEKQQSLARALVLGDKSALPGEDSAAFSASGLAHVLCVSGLHVGIVFMFLSFACKGLKKFRTGQLVYFVVVLTGVWAFAFVTGLAPSVCRAALMLSFLLIAGLLKSKTNLWLILSNTAFVLLVIDPSMISQLGFQLSFLAVISIGVFFSKLTLLFGSRFWLLRKVNELAMVSVSAQMGTSPLSLYYFHSFPVYFLPANIVVVPFASILVYLALASMLFLPIPFISDCLVYVLDRALLAFQQMVSFFSALPGAQWEGMRFDVWDMALLFFIVVILGFCVYLKRARYCFVFFLSLSLLMLVDLSEDMYYASNNENILIAFPGKKPVLVSIEDRHAECVFQDSLELHSLQIPLCDFLRQKKCVSYNYAHECYSFSESVSIVFFRKGMEECLDMYPFMSIDYLLVDGKTAPAVFSDVRGFALKELFVLDVKSENLKVEWLQYAQKEGVRLRFVESPFFLSLN